MNEKNKVKNSRPVLRNKEQRLDYIDTLETKLQESIDKTNRQDNTISRLTREEGQNKKKHEDEIVTLKKTQEDEVKGLNAKIKHLKDKDNVNKPKPEPKKVEKEPEIPYAVLEAMYKERVDKVKQLAEAVESLLNITSDTSAAIKGIVTLSDNNIRSLVEHELNKKK